MHRFSHTRVLALVLPFAIGMSAESAAQRTGLKLAPPGSLKGIPAAIPPSGAGKPLLTKVDLSKAIPFPGDQGNQNSCVAWAVAYALKTYQEGIETGMPFLDASGKLIPPRTFSPAFIYNQINQGQDGGAYFIDALNLVHTAGAATFASMPYVDTDYKSRPTAAALTEARPYRIDRWRPVDARNPTEVKMFLAAGNPILFGVRIDAGFKGLAAGQIWSQHAGQPDGYHAMVIVGYDDARRAFKFANSWGAGWGDQGYGWVDYQFLSQVVEEAYLVKDALNGTVVSAPVNPGSEKLNVNGVLVLDSSVGGGSGRGGGRREIRSPSDSVTVDVNGATEEPLEGSRRAMRFKGMTTVPPKSGKTFHIQLAFFYDAGDGKKGDPVGAAASAYANARGLAVASTEQARTGATTPQGWTVVVPTDAFEFQAAAIRPTGEVRLLAEPTLFIDGFSLRTASPFAFVIRR